MMGNSQDERQQQRRRAIEEHAAAAAPVLADIRAAGVGVQTLDELRRSGRAYREAIPVLLAWLPRVSNLEVKESLVRCLSVPWAKPAAAKVLIEEFHRAPLDARALRWAIGNAIEVVADATVGEEILDIVTDPANGTTRQMFVLALAKLENPRAVEVLIRLLNDEDVAEHAAEALGKLKAIQSKSALESLLTHPKDWVRKAASTALARMTKGTGRRQGVQ